MLPVQEEPVDRRVLAEFRELEMLTEMIDAFLAEAPQLLAQIKQAIEQGDAETLRMAAHTLKGSGGNMGARPVQQLSRTLEKMARQGVLEGAVEIFQALEREYERAREVFEAERGTAL